MRRGITFLLLWLIVDFLLSGVFVLPIPPGGVSWPYYLFVVCIPLGAMLYARFPGRQLVVVCYGVLAGVGLALPLFDDERAVVAGATTVLEVALKVLLFALVTSLVCNVAFIIGQRLFRRIEVTLTHQ